MIGFDELGSKGWLGNQMFQYASLKGIAIHNNYEYCIPPKDNRGITNYRLHDVFKLKNLKHTGYIGGLYRHHSSDRHDHSTSSHFSEEFLNECPDNVNISGFFQTEKWFKHCRDELLEDFEFMDWIKEPCQKFLSKFKTPPIFLHVRRGDYLRSSQYHYVQTIDYYENAIKYFDEGTEILIFSDDIEWCRNQNLFKNDRFYFSQTEERLPLVMGYDSGALVPEFDLCLMSMCSGAIIANSSFSWWGAWLQKDNTNVVSPKRWFGPANSHLYIDDIYLDCWKRI
jgi:hypothetical protein